MTADPLALVREWCEAAAAAGIVEWDAAALATAAPDGRPSVRYVLIKGVTADGVRFFSNYESRKGRELSANPRAALAVLWQPLHRQLQLEGPVRRLTAEDSDAYFASRPAGSRLGAWASNQGTPIPEELVLEDRVAELAERFGEEIPRPEHWGGYELRPDAVELWEGRPNRLHHRTHFLREPGGGWRSERLSP